MFLFIVGVFEYKSMNEIKKKSIYHTNIVKYFPFLTTRIHCHFQNDVGK